MSSPRSGLSRRSVLSAGALSLSALAVSHSFSPARAAAATPTRALRTALSGRAGTLSLLTDPFLQAPTADGVSVVWMTEYAGSSHVLLVGDAVATLSDEQLRAAAAGTPPAGVRSFSSASIRLSRTAEDRSSFLDVKPTPEQGVVPRPVHRHEAVATGLAAGSRTPYRIVSTDGDGFVASGTFELAPAARPGQALTILLTSDHQAMVNTAANLQLAKETVGDIDAVFLAGDLVNVPDRASEWFDDTRGSAFFPCLQGRGGRVSTGGVEYHGGEIIQYAPLFPAVGNHEVQGRRDGATTLSLDNTVPREVAEKAYAKVAATVNPTDDPAVKAQWIEDNSWSTTTYEEIFTLPDDSPGGRQYYAVTLGDVRLVSLFSTRIWRGTTANADPAARTANSRYQEAAANLSDPMKQGYGEFVFSSLAVGSEQYDWLEEELASDEFQGAPIKVVMLHEGPQGLGDNVMPVFADPERIEVRDAAGVLTSVRYEYRPQDNMLLHDLQPLLESAGTDLVLNGHSHLWNRFRSEGGTHWLETSNTGNTYGAFHGLSNRTRPLPPAPWNSDYYLSMGNPGGLDPIVPTVEPFTNPDGVPLPFVQSNDLCVFTTLQTDTREVTAWVYDVKRPEVKPWVFDRFTLGRDATTTTATATATTTGGTKVAGTVEAATPANGTVVVSEATTDLALATVVDGTFTAMLPAGLLEAGAHTLTVTFPQTATHLASSTTVTVDVTAPPAGAPGPAGQPGPAGPAGHNGRDAAVVTALLAKVTPQRVRLRVHVAVESGSPAGMVTVRRRGGALLRTATVGADGNLSLVLPRKKLGKGRSTTLQVTYLGTEQAGPSVGTVSFSLPRR